MNNSTLGKVLIAAVAFLAGFVIGSLWSENKLLKSGYTGGTGTLPTAEGDSLPEANFANMPEITEADHVRGNPDAEVVLVEYSDYECPFCSLFHPTMTQVMEEYGDRVAWVYRHYPLSIHPQAQPTAVAAECVAQLGGNDAFWQFTDTVFETTLPLVNAQQNPGTALTADKLLTYATQAGISASAMQDCLDNGDTASIVSEDQAGGTAAGITGTPGTILMTKDGRYELISGAQPYEQVKAALERYL